jgi:predicted nucleic acid-binding protein
MPIFSFDRFSGVVALLVPASAVEEARAYLPAICIKRRIPAQPALDLLDNVLGLLQVVDLEFFGHLEGEARGRIAARDPDDWPMVALALAVDAPLWTQDPDFFGSGIATWTTATVERYLEK